MVSLAPWASLLALYLASGTTAPAFVMDPSGHGSDVCLLQFMHKGTSLGAKTTEGMEEMAEEAEETTDETGGTTDEALVERFDIEPFSDFSAK